MAHVCKHCHFDEFLEIDQLNDDVSHPNSVIKTKLEAGICWKDEDNFPPNFSREKTIPDFRRLPPTGGDFLNRISAGSEWNFGYLFYRKLQAELKTCKTVNGELQSQNNKMQDQLRFLVFILSFN